MKNLFRSSLFSLLVLAACTPKIELLPETDTQQNSAVASLVAATRDNNLGMGNPSGASTSNNANYLLTKTQFSISYNQTQAKPNWVSWHLSSAWLGSTPRQDNFSPDNSLPSSFYKVTTNDYRGSGFDRGHNCPSADRNGSVADNSATFLMTNMMPQAPRNNQISWARLEDYCRTLAGQGNELYIIAGSAGQGGTGTVGTAQTIASGKIVVPNYTWKVILVIPNGTNDVSRVTNSTRLIAVKIPNNQSIGNNWELYKVSARSLEQTLGYNFFSNLPVSIQDVIENNVDSLPTL